MTDARIRGELKAMFPDRPIRLESGVIFLGDERVDAISPDGVQRSPLDEIARLARIIRYRLAALPLAALGGIVR